MSTIKVTNIQNPNSGTNDIIIDASGDVTTTGNLTVPSLNTGQLSGFRNVLINGKVSINQRGVTYAATAVGDYWADRWKKTAGGMTQIVEDGNYQPSTQYTLSGTGVTTQQITSPASGNWTIPDVPATATNIQLEPGPVATPFEYRPIGTELALCQRYFQKYYIQQRGKVDAAGVAVSVSTILVPKRTDPTFTFEAESNGGISGNSTASVYPSSLVGYSGTVINTATTSGQAYTLSERWTADAEL